MRTLELPRVDGIGGIRPPVPEVIVAGWCTRRRDLDRFDDILLQRRGDDVLTDDKSIAIAQSMRRPEAAFRTVQERAAG